MIYAFVYANNDTNGNLTTSQFLLFLYRYGWLADSTLRYPMHSKSYSCGNHIGIVGSSTPSNKAIMKNAWCYKE